MDEANKGTTAPQAPERKERKRLGPVARLIPWILGGLIGIGLIWLFTNIVDMPDEDATIAVDTLQSPNLNEEKPAAGGLPTAVDRVAEFIRFADQNRAARVGPEHIYASDGISRLAAAIDALSEQFMADSSEMEPRLQRLRAAAGNLRENGASSNGSAEVRNAFQTAAEMLSAVQRQSFPQAAGQMEGVRQAATAIRGERPLPDQITAIEAYFRQVGSTLQTMTAPEIKPAGTGGPSS